MLCGVAVQGARFSPMQAVDLQCEYLTTPLGIRRRRTPPDVEIAISGRRSLPERLPGRRGDLARAARSRERRRMELGADQIRRPDGRMRPAAPLKSHTRYFWKVETWDDNGRMAGH